MNTKDKIGRALSKFEIEFNKNYVYGEGAKSVDNILQDFEFDWELEQKLVKKLDMFLERETKRAV